MQLTRMIVTLQNWIQPDIAVIMGGGLQRVITVAHDKQRSKDIRMDPLEGKS